MIRLARLTKQFESSSNEWETPDEVFIPLNREFNFTLDAAATEYNAKVKPFISKESDAFAQRWSGVVWLNPPYGRGLDKWMKKANDERCLGVTTVALIPARTNTRWFHRIVLPNAEVRFVEGRPKFGDANEGLPWPLLIVIFKGREQGD